MYMAGAWESTAGQWPKTKPQGLKTPREAREGHQQGNTPQWSSDSREEGKFLTPAAHCVLSARHDIFTLLVFTRNHFKLDGCVTHSMVSLRENKDNG